jgi:hypothetical protein
MVPAMSLLNLRENDFKNWEFKRISARRNALALVTIYQGSTGDNRSLAGIIVVNILIPINKEATTKPLPNLLLKVLEALRNSIELINGKVTLAINVAL